MNYWKYSISCYQWFYCCLVKEIWNFIAKLSLFADIRLFLINIYVSTFLADTNYTSWIFNVWIKGVRRSFIINIFFADVEITFAKTSINHPWLIFFCWCQHYSVCNKKNNGLWKLKFYNWGHLMKWIVCYFNVIKRQKKKKRSTHPKNASKKKFNNLRISYIVFSLHICHGCQTFFLSITCSLPVIA